MAKRNDSCSNVGTRYNEIEESRCNLCVQTTYQTKNSKHLKKIHESILRNLPQIKQTSTRNLIINRSQTKCCFEILHLELNYKEKKPNLIPNPKP